jgi:hypothetical protein
MTIDNGKYSNGDWFNLRHIKSMHHPPTKAWLVGLNIMIPILNAEPASGHRSRSSVFTVGLSWSEEVRMSASG